MFEVEIARGMALLDQIVPDWRAKVPADDRLDMRFTRVEDQQKYFSGHPAVPCGCTLAHVFGDANDGMHILDAETRVTDFAAVSENADRLGFSAANGDFCTLTAEWRAALRADPEWQRVHAHD